MYSRTHFVWLWEAAIYESGDFVEPKTISYHVNGNFPTFSELNADYNGSNTKIYDVGYLFAEYILSTWGSDSYIDLIKSNGYIQKTLSITTSEFEAGWKQFVLDKYF